MPAAATEMRARGRAGGSAIGLGLVPFLAVGLVWMLAVHVARVPQVFLPPLEELPGVVVRMFTQEGIAGDVAISAYRVVGGFALALLLATPLGVWMGYSARARLTLDPFMGFMRYMPVPSFIPLTILWLHTGHAQKMAIIFLGAFFQLVLMVADAAKAVPREFYESAEMLRATRRDVILRVVWPAALPQIFDSYRICVGWAWTYLVVAEIVGATSGVGYYIIKAQRYLLVPQIFAAMMLIGLLGMLTDLLLAAAGRRLFPWAQQAPDGARA